MEWIDRLNHAVGYIEKNLDGEIDYDEISRITVSPIALFQRFFVLTTGYTLTEYIRRRKLTCALTDLQTTDAKVIDVAFKYCYESSDAFCVAFKRLYDITPSQAKKTTLKLKHYDRIYFNLTISYVKGEKDMVLLNVDNFRYYDPVFESVRIVLNYAGEKFTPEYVLGISGSTFKIAGGCPSRPTCVCDFWPADFLKYLGYEVKEYPCFDQKGNDISDKMIEAVKKQIDGGKPALIFSAFSYSEWDVVCGYDDEAQQFVGRRISSGVSDYARDSWDRAKKDENFPAGAVLIGEKVAEFDTRQAEINSLRSAVKHARQETDNVGIKFYHDWAAEYAKEGKDRGLADVYCYAIYMSVRGACVGYLQEIANGDENLLKAADCFEREKAHLDSLWPYLGWESPWGVDEERSKNVAPILKEAAVAYEQG
ncbi:MAG: helix-turn-helix domain-containing protein, partial [Oscillospiraceae bacterium]|nr:helix-turn-helix domain-containing protein [Oscillospiraceae bacterium]